MTEQIVEVDEQQINEWILIAKEIVSCVDCESILKTKEQEFFSVCQQHPIFLKHWLSQISEPLEFMREYRIYKRNDLAISHFINQVELHLLFLNNK